MRIDQLLVQRGLASTRSQAQRLIADGVEWLYLDAWKRVSKNGDEVPDSADIRLLDDSEARYVSRGGLKTARVVAAGTVLRIALTPVVMALILLPDAEDDGTRGPHRERVDRCVDIDRRSVGEPGAVEHREGRFHAIHCRRHAHWRSEIAIEERRMAEQHHP